jgi:hypothetical protein
MAASNVKPTTRQVRYLRQLAELTGTSFTPPATRRQARREIDRLRQRSASNWQERGGDCCAVSRGLGEQQPASSVRPDEVAGYGSNCQWANDHPERP